MRNRLWMWLGLLVLCCMPVRRTWGIGLTYLDSPVDPYYVGLDTARLITPQWVGDDGVEAVIVLAIDDMTDADKYEQFLRPILNRLQANRRSRAGQYHDQADRSDFASYCRRGPRRVSASRRTHTTIRVPACRRGASRRPSRLMIAASIS